MTMLSLLLVLAADPTVWRSGEKLLLEEPGKGLRYIDLRGAAPERALEGNLLTLCRKGAVLREPQGCVWLSFTDGTRTPLAELPDVPVPLALSDVDGPVIATRDRLLVLQGAQWRALAWPVWYELSQPRPVPGSLVGIQPIWPTAFTDARGNLCVYQAKNGRLLCYDPRSERTTTSTLATKLVPIPLRGGDLLWIGLPKDDHLALAGRDPGAAPVADVAIDNLSEHSLVLPATTGAWLLTFASGLRDGMKSWDRGTVRIEAVFVKPSERRISLQKLTLGELPVNFALSTSAGGSPKLAVTPAFTPLVVEGRDRLAIVRANRLEWLDPTGKRGSVSLTGKGKPLALAARGTGVEVYEASRHYLQDWGKQP